jgi:hypothetical protein
MSAKKEPDRQPGISADIAEKIRNANLSNLIKKVKSGKTLTAAEIKLIDEAESQTARKGSATPKIPDTAQSMSQAASIWGIPKNILRVAKASGCPAFVEHRIHRDALLKWLDENPDTATKGETISDASELKRQKLQAEVELLRVKIDMQKRDLITMAEARAEWSRALSIGQEEAKNLMESDVYRVFCERWKSRCGEVLPT